MMNSFLRKAKTSPDDDLDLDKLAASAASYGVFLTGEPSYEIPAKMSFDEFLDLTDKHRRLTSSRDARKRLKAEGLPSFDGEVLIVGHYACSANELLERIANKVGRENERLAENGVTERQFLLASEVVEMVSRLSANLKQELQDMGRIGFGNPTTPIPGKYYWSS